MVLIDTLEQRLAAESEDAVLLALAAGDALLTTVCTTNVCCALVSYKQERRAGSTSGTLDALTIDGAALRGIVAAARSLKVDALWLDAWCYHSPGAYDHADFCRTLRDVAEGVEAVIWLPRSKAGSPGHYAFRLWCTYEVACVHRRGLPVAIAGEGLGSIQRRMRRFGSFTPALYTNGPTDELCRLNLLFYVAELGQLFEHIVVRSSFAHRSLFFLFGDFAFSAIAAPFFWLALRAILGQQVRLARNAWRTLRTMTRAAAVTELSKDVGGKLLARGETIRTFAQHNLTELTENLPWLPCYDRRDVLVIHELIGSRPDSAAPSDNDITALAFSAFVAARMQPSPGDEDAARLSLDAWLAQRNISLSTLSGRHGGQRALPSGVAKERLPLEELRQLSWLPAPGASCALFTPLGALAVDPPVDGTWSTSGATPLRRPQLSLASSLFFAQLGVIGLLVGSVVAAHDRGHLSEAFVVDFGLFRSITELLLIGIPLVVWHADIVHARSRRVPLPLVVFYQVRSSVTAIAANVLAALFLIGVTVIHFLNTFLFHTSLDDAVHLGTTNTASRIIKGVAFGTLSIFFCYQTAVYTVYTRHQARHFRHLGGRGERLQMGAALWASSPVVIGQAPAAAAEVSRSVWRFLSRTSDRRLRELSSGCRSGAKIGDDDSARLELTDQSSRRNESSIEDLDLSFSGKSVFLPPCSPEPLTGRVIADQPLVLRSSGKSSAAAGRSDVSQTSLRSQHT